MSIFSFLLRRSENQTHFETVLPLGVSRAGLLQFYDEVGARMPSLIWGAQLFHTDENGRRILGVGGEENTYSEVRFRRRADQAPMAQAVLSRHFTVVRQWNGEQEYGQSISLQENIRLDVDAFVQAVQKVTSTPFRDDREYS